MGKAAQIGACIPFVCLNLNSRACYSTHRCPRAMSRNVVPALPLGTPLGVFSVCNTDHISAGSPICRCRVTALVANLVALHFNLTRKFSLDCNFSAVCYCRNRESDVPRDGQRVLMAQTKSNDWWERERQRFLKRILICLLLVLLLIGYFSYINLVGRTGFVKGVNFPTANYIAFVRREDDGTSVIYAVKADGSDERRLTIGNDAANKEHPSWTPDGKALVFSSNLKDLQTTQIYILGDGAPVQLTYGSGNKFSPTVSPDGKHVAFITQGVVKTVTITGNDVTQVMPLPRSGSENGTDSGGSETELQPYIGAAFSSDGITLSGIQDISNATIQMHTSDSDETKNNPSKVTTLPVDQQVIVLPGSANKPFPPIAQGHEVSVAWEPSGARMACSYTELPMLDQKGRPVDTQAKPLPKGSSPLPISGIQIWSFNGQKPTYEPLYGCLGYSAEPKNIAWSASDNPGVSKASRIAFELWLLKSEGVRELAGIRVLDVGEGGTDENGAPKSQRFLTMPSDVPNIPLLVKASADGKPQNPRWSPDGRRLVYEMVHSNGKRDLWTINPDGTNPINLTKGKGDNTDAAWAPAL